MLSDEIRIPPRWRKVSARLSVDRPLTDEQRRRLANLILDELDAMFPLASGDVLVSGRVDGFPYEAFGDDP